MSTLLNTLYVTTEGSQLYKDHETVVVKVEGTKRLQVPLLHLCGIVCMGPIFVSPELMAACCESGIHIAFFSMTGRFLSRVEGMPGGNVLLRRQQHRAADDVACSLRLSRSMVLGKLSGGRQFLLHARRDAAADRKDALEHAGDRLAIHLAALARAETVDELRGLEGIAAKDYFSVFDLLIKRTEPELHFGGRSRRPPRDRVNALLSFGYALLAQDCAGALAGVGLDPAVGYLHEERPGRLSLALDLMEELRCPVVDRLVVAMLNRSQFAPSDFICDDGGGWRLIDEARKRFLLAYQESKQGDVQHPLLQQRIAWGRVPHIQAALLARTLRGDLDEYPPFVFR
ncbi:MAG: type I-C CRISPR-associated endonuclease Cas1 [Myxococcales bacterium]|nr:type I-C CRISPR-associated endonuclease Cas1 [Myxococcales bacterium]